MGDNFASTVTGIEVKYLANGKEHDSCYVVKLNPQIGVGIHNDMTCDIFVKESAFYLKFLPEVNGVMKNIGQPLLNFPQCYHSSLNTGKEQIYFEDLRKRGFKMVDRLKGMGVEHATLVMKELARLHAASLILQSESPEPIEIKHDYLTRNLFSMPKYSKEVIYPMMEANLNNTIQILEHVGGYAKVITWVEGLKPKIEDIFSAQLKSEGFNVVCHGDCWNNNLLFRHNSAGSPVEVMFVDLQLSRTASLAIDLNYFMYASLTSDVRRPNLKMFLNSYYKYFKEVTDAGGIVMPFTEEDLLVEFRSKNNLGAIFAMTSIPVLLMQSEDYPDMKEFGGDFRELMKEMNKKSMAALDTHPLIKPRLLATFDEFIETGLIS